MDLKKIIKDAREKARGGDVNVATVGEGAQVEQIAVGRNILQAKINIGSLVVPVRFLLALLAVAAVIAVAVWWIATPGQMKPGEGAINIALVDFAGEDAKGTATNSAQGTFLSNWLYASLTREFKDLPEASRPTIWQISTSPEPTHLFQKRVFLSPVVTKDDARRVADQFGARIVIYGMVKSEQGTENFTPQFYVQPVGLEAPELSGSQQMGRPIVLQEPVSDTYLETYLQPLGRAAVLMARGISFDLFGRFDSSAYQALTQGAPQLQNWDETQGKEILYFFIGSQALFLGQCESDAARVFPATADRSSVELALDEAERAFNEAKRIQPAYPRAYFGLAQVAVQRAQPLTLPPGVKPTGQCRLPNSSTTAPTTPAACPERANSSPDAANLDEARTLYMNALDLHNKALDLMQGSDDPLLLHRIQAARATTELPLAGLLLLKGETTNAEPLLQNGVDTLDTLKNSINPDDDHRGLATVYLALGNGHLLQANMSALQGDANGNKSNLQAAVGAFEACINVVNKYAADTYLRDYLAPNCSCTQAAAKNALEQIK